MVKKDEDGTTSGAKKTPLILKDFFPLKSDDNNKSMTYHRKSHEDGLTPEQPNTKPGKTIMES